jgi:CRISPR-associated protein Csh2
MVAGTARRSEFLFLFDTRMANPNGDPDENRPRIDPYSGKNLVTEYRLKRTIRDYLRNQGEAIFIREDLNKDGSRKTIEELAEPYIKGKKKEKTVDRDKLIKEHIDVRLFGLLFAVPDATFKSIGPVQFSIGQSLNKVQEILVRNTRIVPTKEDAKAGTFGEKTIVRYSLIIFHGFLNQIAAKESNLSEGDIEKMMLAMWHGTNNLSTSSKFGQISRLLLRVIYADDKAYLGDLDRGISLPHSENIEDISQAGIDPTELFSILAANKRKIAEIQFGCHDGIILANGTDNLKTLIIKWAEDNGIKYRNILGN